MNSLLPVGNNVGEIFTTLDVAIMNWKTLHKTYHSIALSMRIN